jgi:hypothetical protein
MHAGWDRRSGVLHKRSRSHHGRENDFIGACGRHDVERVLRRFIRYDLRDLG